jgi:hypothetical protein
VSPKARDQTQENKRADEHLDEWRNPGEGHHGQSRQRGVGEHLYGGVGERADLWQPRRSVDEHAHPDGQTQDGVTQTSRREAEPV